MNKLNLLRAANYIEKIPQSAFSMRLFRSGDEKTHECGAIGCVIGHCTVLDAPENLPLYKNNGGINFWRWSENFFGCKVHSPEWEWCFSSNWKGVDNTPTGAAARIRYLVKNGVPENRRKQMLGYEQVCYK